MIARTVMLACVALALAACKKPGAITITVTNESGLAAADVELRWESHHRSIGTVPPGETRVVTMEPQPESGLRVAFRLPSGETVERIWDVGYDENARAHVTVTLRAGGEVSFRNPEAGPP